MCLSCSDDTVHEISDISGRVWRFEWHHFCGPMVVGTRGEPMARQPGTRSPFWLALTAWQDERKKEA